MPRREFTSLHANSSLRVLLLFRIRQLKSNVFPNSRTTTRWFTPDEIRSINPFGRKRNEVRVDIIAVSRGKGRYTRGLINARTSIFGIEIEGNTRMKFTSHALSNLYAHVVKLEYQLRCSWNTIMRVKFQFFIRCYNVIY